MKWQRGFYVLIAVFSPPLEEERCQNKSITGSDARRSDDQHAARGQSLSPKQEEENKQWLHTHMYTVEMGNYYQKIKINKREKQNKLQRKYASWRSSTKRRSGAIEEDGGVEGRGATEDWLSVQDPQETITTTAFSAPHTPHTQKASSPPQPANPTPQSHRTVAWGGGLVNDFISLWIR